MGAILCVCVCVCVYVKQNKGKGGGRGRAQFSFLRTVLFRVKFQTEQCPISRARLAEEIEGTFGRHECGA